MNAAKIALTALLASICATAHAASPKLSDAIKLELQVTDESLASCRYVHGGLIQQDSCDRWRRALDKAYTTEREEEVAERAVRDRAARELAYQQREEARKRALLAETRAATEALATQATASNPDTSTPGSIATAVQQVSEPQSQRKPLDPTKCRNFAGQRVRTAECHRYFLEVEPESDIECAASQECTERRRRTAEAFELARKQEIERRNQEIERQAAAEEERHRKRESARRSACGADYQTPQIGMTIDRVTQCVAKLTKIAQLNRADGVVTTYRTGSGAVFHAMDGRVVAWSR
jgi:hypothetical protein